MHTKVLKLISILDCAFPVCYGIPHFLSLIPNNSAMRIYHNIHQQQDKS